MDLPEAGSAPVMPRGPGCDPGGGSPLRVGMGSERVNENETVDV